MKRDRFIALIAIILIIVLMVPAGILVSREWADEFSAQKKRSVIKGERIVGSITMDAETIERMKQEEVAENESVIENSENTPADTNRTEIQQIQAQLESLANTEYGAGGTVSICTGRTDETEMAMVGGGRMQAASLIKLYVAGAVYENYGTVSAQEVYAGETESLLSVMITVSDNTACNTLVTRLGNGDARAGMACVNQYCASHGFADTHMGRLMLQPNDTDDNYTSVRDCCNYLKMANAGQLEGSASVLGYMKQQQRRSKIPAGIPNGVPVGNKTGELSDVENDAAIVYSGGCTYVLCVMSEHLSDTYRAQQFITRTSSVVYEAMQ